MPRTPRSSWIDQGLRALGTSGPDAVRIERLARTLGVTKGGFYGYFADRDALIEEMLDTWERIVIDEAVERVEVDGGDARAKLRRLFELGSFRGDLLRVELAIRDWARRDPAVAARLRRVDNRRMEYMRALFRAFCDDDDEVEVRCTLVMSLFVAVHFFNVDHGPYATAAVLELALTRLLE
jgi:AcrR family transcriptional regulator